LTHIYINIHTTMEQTRMDSHYLTYQGDERFAKITSDRLRNAVTQITGKRTALSVGKPANKKKKHHTGTSPQD
jgi:hypothetical protein